MNLNIIIWQCQCQSNHLAILPDSLPANLFSKACLSQAGVRFTAIPGGKSLIRNLLPPPNSSGPPPSTSYGDPHPLRGPLFIFVGWKPPPFPSPSFRQPRTLKRRKCRARVPACFTLTKKFKMAEEI